MTAGVINPQWLAQARINEGADETVEAWIARATNCETVEIAPDGSVWVVGPLDGQWLTQDQIDRVCATIDAGV